MDFRLLGFKFGKNDKIKPNQKVIVSPNAEDGSLSIDSSHYGYYIDTEISERNETQLIDTYRSIAQNPEAENAIEDIINEAIVEEPETPIVTLATDQLEMEDKDKERIGEEFQYILQLLDFRNNAHEIFRRWYVDGRLFYHKVIDNEKPSEGIQQLIYIDAKKIKKISELERGKDPKTGADLITGISEYYIFSEVQIDSAAQNHQGLKLAPDSICYVHSGIIDPTSKVVISHLHKAIRPLNQLRMIEDSLVIYRLARAPERRIFYVDVGNMPKQKAEQYLRGLMNSYKNKMVYNASTGEMVDNRRHLSMLEDFWLPRRDGKGTEVTNLPGGANLGEMEDVRYFQNKLYKSLNVPISRLESDNHFNLGRASEITRDELKFVKFVDRLKTRFSGLFDDLLRTQLVLKGLIKIHEWDDIKEKLSYRFNRDSFFTEMKDAEVMRERVALARDMEDMVGKYYSRQYIRHNVLMQSDEDIKAIDAEIKAEPDENQRDPVIISTDNNDKKFDPDSALPDDLRIHPDTNPQESELDDLDIDEQTLIEELINQDLLTIGHPYDKEDHSA